MLWGKGICEKQLRVVVVNKHHSISGRFVLLKILLITMHTNSHAC